MNLRRKAFLIVITTLAPLFFGAYFFLSKVILDDFRVLEKGEMGKNLQRISDSYEGELKSLKVKVTDWGQWNYAYEYINNQNTQFVQDNLINESLDVLGLNYLIYRKKSGEVLYENFFNPINGNYSVVSEETKKTLFTHPKIIQHESISDALTGPLEVSEGLVLLSSRGVTDSEGGSPVSGSLFFGYLFDQEDIQKLSDVTHLGLSFLKLEEFVTRFDPKIVEEIAKSNNHTYIPSIKDSEEKSTGYLGVYDIDNKLVGIFEIKEERNTFSRGQNTVSLFGRWMLFFATIFTAIVLLLVEFLVLRRLILLNKQVEKISSSDISTESTIQLSGEDELAFLAKSINDANERTQFQKERAESILNFLRSIGEGVFATNTEGEMIFINKTAEKFLSTNTTLSNVKHASSVFHFFLQNQALDILPYDPFSLIQKTDKPITFPEKTFLQKEGVHIPILGTMAPIKNQEGEKVGTITVFQDITERYELDKLKDSFISVAAHQLRTPLGSMRWSIELLSSGDLGELSSSAQEVLATLYSNSERMHTLVNDLLNTSRIEQKKGQEGRTLVDLKKIITHAVESLAGQASEEGVVVESSLPSQPLTNILLVETHIQEAILNVLSNAIKYTPSGGKVIITLSEQENKQVVSIQDTGIGIPEKDQDKIFSKFYRASNAVHQDTDSSGLGLYVVKSYMDEAQGDITIESNEGKGTIVTLSFPFGM
jgi:signal transduction histidine kinase